MVLRPRLALALLPLLVGCGNAITPPETRTDGRTGIGRFPEFAKVEDASGFGAPSGDHYPTGFNVRVSTSLVKELGDAPAFAWVRDTLLEGGACLDKLEGDGSTDNLRRLRLLLSDTTAPVRLSFEPLGALTTDALEALATAPGEPGFPSIRFNSDDNAFRNSSTQGRKQTLFHELFHNLGYLHFRHVEYPYACAACCFPSEKSKPETKDAACRVCSSRYAGAFDARYVADVADFLKLDDQDERALEIVERYLAEKPADRKAWLQLPRLYRAGFPSLVSPLTVRIRERWKDLSAEEEKLLAEAAVKDAWPADRVAASEALADAIVAKVGNELERLEEALRRFGKNPPQSPVVPKLTEDNADEVLVKTRERLLVLQLRDKRNKLATALHQSYLQRAVLTTNDEQRKSLTDRAEKIRRELLNGR